jgi:hypothetical protein
MMKSLLLTSAFAGLMAMAPAVPSAEAKTNVIVRFDVGVPYYAYQTGPDYVYRRGYGWYRPVRRPVYGNRLSCQEAGRIVRRNGYYNVYARECGGSTYTFTGFRNGRRFVVYVNARSGAVWRG